ncbi:hypothetical protein CR513_38341, partial [Mucuna pruriens]
MYHYIEILEMMHLAIKVEQQLNRRNSLKKKSNSRKRLLLVHIPKWWIQRRIKLNLTPQRTKT